MAWRLFFRTLTAFTLLGGACSAQAADCANPRKSDGTMGEAVYKAVEKANEALSKKQYNEVIDQLGKVAASEVSNYEKAIVYYNLGFAYSGKEDYRNAARVFKSALDLNALPQQQHDQLQYNTGQLLILDKQYDAGIKLLEQYLATSCTPPPADANVFLASAYSEDKQFANAIKQIDLAIAKAGKPKEVWLQLRLAASYELKDYKTSAQTLVQLIGMNPSKPDYWSQLSSVLYQNNNESESVAVLGLAERQGFVDKPNQIRNLYNIYMMLDLPYKAGSFLQDAIDKGRVPNDETNLSAVADAWINARELPKAEAVLRKLGDMSSKGEYYFKLGAIYGDNERWKESRDMIQLAIQKGGLKRTGDAWLRLGVAQYNLKDYKAAEAALQKAGGFDESRKQAGEYLQIIRQETGATG